MIHIRNNKSSLTCPQCGGETKRIEIVLEVYDWGKILMLGWIAMFFPSKDRALVCEHCGNVFGHHKKESALSQKVTRILILLIGFSVMTGVIAIIAKECLN